MNQLTKLAITVAVGAAVIFGGRVLLVMHAQRQIYALAEKHIPPPKVEPAIKYVGEITNEKGSYEIWQDPTGKYHYTKTGAKHEGK